MKQPECINIHEDCELSSNTDINLSTKSIKAMPDSKANDKVVLITGAGKRVGAAVAQYCHQLGMRLAIHYRESRQQASDLCARFNQQRQNSAIALAADLRNTDQLEGLITAVLSKWGQLDVLINNASSFYPTPLAKVTEMVWEDVMGSNLKAPFFLSQSAAPYLKQQKGCIINLVDIQAQRPLKNYSVYCIAKAGLVMLTKSLAQELGPDIRVNAIAPGIVLWPDDETEFNATLREKIVARNVLKRAGTPQDIANTAVFLINHANFITGQIIAVDGGRSLGY
ncbi:MAG: pteridine reductase [Candidatus Aquirickettsiella sp.]